MKLPLFPSVLGDKVKKSEILHSDGIAGSCKENTGIITKSALGCWATLQTDSLKDTH